MSRRKSKREKKEPVKKKRKWRKAKIAALIAGSLALVYAANKTGIVKMPIGGTKKRAPMQRNIEKVHEAGWLDELPENLEDLKKEPWIIKRPAWQRNIEKEQMQSMARRGNPQVYSVAKFFKDRRKLRDEANKTVGSPRGTPLKDLDFQEILDQRADEYRKMHASRKRRRRRTKQRRMKTY
jgi:hypothetical protein